MKPLRPVFIGVLLAAAFVFYTSHHPGAVPFIASREAVQVTQAAGTPALDPEEQNNVEIYKKVSPSVVNVTSTQMAFDFFYGPVPQEGAGSGFIIDKEGHILTNYHVVANANRLEVTLANKKKYKAQVIGLDRSHDLAVIQIQAPSLEPVVLGDSRRLAGRAEGVCHRQSVRHLCRNHDARYCQLHPLGADSRRSLHR